MTNDGSKEVPDFLEAYIAQYDEKADSLEITFTTGQKCAFTREQIKHLASFFVPEHCFPDDKYLHTVDCFLGKNPCLEHLEG